MNNFQVRVISSVVIIVITLFGLFYNELSFRVLFYLVALGCWWEYSFLTLKSIFFYRLLGLFICTILYWSWFYYENIKPAFYLLFFSITVISLLISEIFFTSEIPFRRVGFLVLGLFYIVLPFVLLNDLTLLNIGSEKVFSPRLVAGLLGLTWAYDTGAYLIGSRLGKNLLIPRISPKKTWDGTIGGAVVCMLMSLTGIPLFHIYSNLFWFVISCIVFISGSLGDLIESLLKRSSGVKDSGFLIPGHGGFLDRFDSFIVVIPFVYLFLVLRNII